MSLKAKIRAVCDSHCVAMVTYFVEKKLYILFPKDWAFVWFNYKGAGINEVYTLVVSKSAEKP